MMPKNAVKINPNDGMYCKTCKSYHYGDPKRIRKKHVCKKVVVQRKYILFGKKITKLVEMDAKPDLVTIAEWKKCRK